jgi:hypothetical protein
LKRRRELRLTKPSQEIQEIQESLAAALGHDEDESGMSELETDDDENNTLYVMSINREDETLLKYLQIRSALVPNRFEKHQG